MSPADGEGLDADHTGNRRCSRPAPDMGSERTSGVSDSLAWHSADQGSEHWGIISGHSSGGGARGTRRRPVSASAAYEGPRALWGLDCSWSQRTLQQLDDVRQWPGASTPRASPTALRGRNGPGSPPVRPPASNVLGPGFRRGPLSASCPSPCDAAPEGPLALGIPRVRFQAVRGGSAAHLHGGIPGSMAPAPEGGHVISAGRMAEAAGPGHGGSASSSSRTGCSTCATDGTVARNLPLFVQWGLEDQARSKLLTMYSSFF